MSTKEFVTVYWRPGCPFCRHLSAALAAAGVSTTDVNIWEIPEAAAIVRSIANGNETVPTVVVGNESFVNPDVTMVLRAIERHAPEEFADLVIPPTTKSRHRWGR